jgi:hypothetical protein
LEEKEQRSTGMKRERKAANLSAGLIAETAPPGKKSNY